MKKLILIILTLAMSASLVGCGGKTEEGAPAEAKQTESPKAEAVVNQEVSKEAEQKESGVTVQPLSDTTMENLEDAILSVSFGEGDVYLDDTGKLQTKAKIYTYDKYDMVDIAQMKVGDIIVTHTGGVEVQALERSESGILFVNGGLEGGGFDLVTDNTTYPESAAGWQLYAQVQSSGNFVCMIVLPEGYTIPENVFEL